MAWNVRSGIISIFIDLETEVQNVLKVGQLLGGNVGIHLLVYLMTNALTFSTILSFESCRSPKYKYEIIVQDEFQLSAHLLR